MVDRRGMEVVDQLGGCCNEPRVMRRSHCCGSCGPDVEGIRKEGLAEFDDRLAMGVRGVLEGKKS